MTFSQCLERPYESDGLQYSRIRRAGVVSESCFSVFFCTSKHKFCRTRIVKSKSNIRNPSKRLRWGDTALFRLATPPFLPSPQLTFGALGSMLTHLSTLVRTRRFEIPVSKAR